MLALYICLEPQNPQREVRVVGSVNKTFRSQIRKRFLTVLARQIRKCFYSFVLFWRAITKYVYSMYVSFNLEDLIKTFCAATDDELDEHTKLNGTGCMQLKVLKKPKDTEHLSKMLC